MQPTLKTQTSVGLETPQQTLDRAGSMLATSATPQQLTAPSFNLNIPSEIPSTALRDATTFDDVMAKRNRAEQNQFASQQLSTDYQNLFGRIGDTQNTPLSNPDQVINRLLLNRPTDTQNALDATGQAQAQNTRDFAGDYAQAGSEARQQFALPELQANLAETRNRIAERTVQLRQTLRDFETNAERRGVDRQFVDSEKQAVQAKAATELADLSIIENAQLGNLQQAQGEVDRLLAEKRQAFEMENMAIEQEIARLEKMDTREADIRKEQLTIALGERSRNIETALANEKEARGYLIEAANNGADNGTLDAIRNAKTPGEAALLAGPWVGRIQRMQAEANIRQSNASARASNASAALNEAQLIKQQKIDEAVANGAVVLDEGQRKEAYGLAKDFEAESKEFKTRVDAYNQIVASAENPSAAGDLSLIFGYMKMLDPNSVVRETEFANAENAAGIPERIRAQYNKALKGERLTENTRTDFIERATTLYNSSLEQQMALEDRYKDRAINLFNLPQQAADLVVQDIRAQGAVSDVAFSLQLNKASDEQISDLVSKGLISTDPYGTQR